MKVSISLWSGNLSRLEDAVSMVEEYVDFFHFDVMDGHYVKNFLFGPDIINSLRHTTLKPFEVHLMIENPDEYLEVFREAGADFLIVHPDTCSNLAGTMEKISKLGAKPGVALKKEARVTTVLPVLDKIRLVLVMATKIGFRSLSFSPSVLSKIRTLKKAIQEQKLNLLIEADGGITRRSVPELVRAGADVIVAGSLVYGSSSVKDTLAELRKMTIEPLSIGSISCLTKKNLNEKV